MKVSGEDYKIKFVEGTSDVWSSPANVAVSDDKQKRRHAVQRWVTGQLPVTAWRPESVEQYMNAMQRHLG